MRVFPLSFLAAVVLTTIPSVIAQTTLIYGGGFNEPIVESGTIRWTDRYIPGPTPSGRLWTASVVGSDPMWTVVDGKATTGSTARGLGQVADLRGLSQAGLSFNQIQVSFEWTPAAGIANTSLNLWLIGFSLTEANPNPANSDVMIRLNDNRVDPDSKFQETFIAGTAEDAAFVVSGATAGQTLFFSQVFTVASGTVADFDLIGVRFRPPTNVAGSTLDNVSVTVVPEPHVWSVLTLALIFGFLVYACKKRRQSAL